MFWAATSTKTDIPEGACQCRRGELDKVERKLFCDQRSFTLLGWRSLTKVINGEEFWRYLLEIFFFGLGSLREARQGIGSNICFVPTLINFQVVTSKFEGQADLSIMQAHSIPEILRAIIIGDDKDFIFAVILVMASSLGNFNNTQYLLILISRLSIS